MDVLEPVAIGSDFLGYRIEEQLGRGGMGVVYRAYDLRLKRPVALKLVAPSLARDERFRERFVRESELVMSLEHANVVPIYDAGDVDGRVYLAMRLVDGSDLGSLLAAQGALEPARAIAICRQVAAALDAAHAHGLVHRDVKPSNVLLDEEEHVYLADFGLTRRLDDKRAGVGEDRSIGTPAYLAPEQLEGGPVDERADIYSLGCVLYECLTGKPVFPRESRLGVAWAHLEEEPPKPTKSRPGLPAAIDGVVGRALAKEPGQRFPTCGALVAAANEALGLGTARTPRRRRAMLLAGALALALVVAAAVTAATLIHGSRRPSRLLAGPNSLIRIDPATKKVAAVVSHVGLNPVAAAGSGRHLWVYGEGSGTISEIDTRTGHPVERASLSTLPPAECCALEAGPVLAADASGAWFVTGGNIGTPYLVHVPVGHQEVTKRRLAITPTGVAVGDGSIWVVGQGRHGDAVLRVNPHNGDIKTLHFPASARIDSIAFGYGAAWVVSSTRSMLYRIDPRSPSHIVKALVADSHATRPELIGGLVWVRAENGLTIWFKPSPQNGKLVDAHWDTTNGPPENQENVWGFGDQWWYDSPSGTVFWDRGVNYAAVSQGVLGVPKHRILVTAKLPSARGGCLSSITTAGGAVWATVALAPVDSSAVCRP